MVCRRRSAQAHRQARHDNGRFRCAAGVSSDESLPVKSCGHTYCPYCAPHSSESEDMKGHGASGHSGGGGGGRQKIHRGSTSKSSKRAQKQADAPPSSSSSSDGYVSLLDLTSESEEETPLNPDMPSSSLRIPASAKGKGNVNQQGPVQNIWSLHDQVALSDERISKLVDELQKEMSNKKALQRALDEARKKGSEK